MINLSEMTLTAAVLLLVVSCLFFSSPERREAGSKSGVSELLIRSTGCLCLIVSLYSRSVLNTYSLLLNGMSILLLMLSLVLEISVARRELAVPSTVLASVTSMLLLFAQGH